MEFRTLWMFSLATLLAATASADRIPPEKAFGTLQAGVKGATLEVVTDGDSKETPKPGSKLTLAPGEYTVVLRQKGHYPVRGKVQVKAGTTRTLAADMVEVPQRNDGEIWSVLGISLGLAAITTAAVLELSGDPETDGAGATRFTLAGVGSAALIAGGISLKWIRSERDNPDPRDGTFQISASPLRDGAFLSAGGSF